MSSENSLPPRGRDGLRHWHVAGGVLIDERGVLLVENRRRGGATDWSTPGGVIDRGETALEALTREVKEETGIAVEEWSDAIYRVEVSAPSAGFFLNVTAHRARSFKGPIVIDDPDGIVIAAEFVDLGLVATRLRSADQWVREPLLAHLDDAVDDGRLFSYRADGGRGRPIRATRTE